MKLHQISRIHKNTEGFTLIELMIVVAIIGILAAIAIPQFAAYRIRGYNASALSDLKELTTSEAAYFANNQGYAVTDTAPEALAIATAGANPVLTGPIPPGAATTSGLHQFLLGADQFMQIPLGQSDSIVAKNDATAQSFTAVTKNTNGDAYYGSDSDVSSIYVANGVDSGANKDVTVVIAAGDCPASKVSNDDFNAGATASGSKPTWQKM